ncbi:MFS transporter [Kitasatospora camelliae]|uniref:MFS transporter n=1 Tax=Kitasatospora camelliae TaxID=3156397 RepID=A0AAU8K6Y2_9ACTN
MSRPDRGGVSYRAVLSLPHARELFAAAMTARVCYGLLGLPLLLALRDGTGSYTVAGATAGLAGLATALLGPYRARWVEHRPPVLLPLACGYALLLTALAAACAGRAPVPVTVGLALAAGVCPPPVGPLMRTLWGRLTSGEAQRQTALSLDTAAESTVFALGPVLGGLLVALWSAPVVLAVVAGLVVAGFGLLARALRGSPVELRDAADGPAARRRSPLRARGFVPLLVLVLAGAAALCLVEIAVLAAWGTVTTGALTTLFSVGGVLGGLAYGRWGTRGALGSRPPVALALAGACYGLPALVYATPSAGLALLLAGACTDVLLVAAYQLVDRLVPDGSRTEASAWVNTAYNLGAAAGAAAGGALVDHAGPVRAFAATAVVLPALGALSALPRVRRPRPRKAAGNPVAENRGAPASRVG